NPQPQVKSQEYGWCAVHKDSDEPYLGAMQVDLMRFCLRLRKVPRSAHEAALKEAIENYERRLQTPISRDERRRLASEVEMKLLSQTPPQYRFFWVVLDRP